MKRNLLTLAAGAFALLLPLAGCARKSEPPVIESHRDASGNQQITVNDKQLRKDLDQAGQSVEKGAKDLGRAVAQGAHDLGNEVGPAARNVALAARVKTRLVAAPDLGGIHIQVEAEEGHVILRGRVASSENRSEAEKIALRTKGVTSVDNQLELGPG